MTLASYHRPLTPSREVLKTLLTLAALLAWAIVELWSPAAARPESVELLNVSYDPTRELYKDVNTRFAAKHEKETGDALVIKQSHGGSGSQARAVIDGLEADVVTLAMWPDTDAIHQKGLIAPGWEERLPNRSVAYTSTIVFLVRKGNPKGIRDWPDLAKPGVEVITPNPKTSGNGKLSLLTIYGSVTERGGTEEEAFDLATRVYRQVPVLDTGARGSTTTFVQKRIGDVNLAWENEAHLAVAESGGSVEIVHPPISFLAEPPVAVVDAVAGRRGTREVAGAYLRFLFTDEGQELAAKHYYRPVDPQVLARHSGRFPAVQRFPITAVAKDWNDAYERFFGPGKIYDRITAAVHGG